VLNNAITSTVTAQASSPATVQGASPSSSSSSSPPPTQKSPAVRITSPTRGQQVPVGKDLTISGTSIDNATSNDCKVSVRVNKISPYQPTTATGTGRATSKDYSKWNFVITSKYTTIKPGQNRITAKYECESNPALTAFSSVNVTGATASTTTAHNISPSSSPSALGLHTKQNKPVAQSNAATVPSNNGNPGTDKIIGSKGNPSGGTSLTSKADEMKNNILESLKQGLGNSG
jgi:hypothetical protein